MFRFKNNLALEFMKNVFSLKTFPYSPRNSRSVEVLKQFYMDQNYILLRSKNMGDFSP